MIFSVKAENVFMCLSFGIFFIKPEGQRKISHDRHRKLTRWSQILMLPETLFSVCRRNKVPCSHYKNFHNLLHNFPGTFPSDFKMWLWGFLTLCQKSMNEVQHWCWTICPDSESMFPFIPKVNLLCAEILIKTHKLQKSGPDT